MYELVYWAMGSFKLFKSLGLDGIFPAQRTKAYTITLEKLMKVRIRSNINLKKC